MSTQKNKRYPHKNFQVLSLCTPGLFLSDGVERALQNNKKAIERGNQMLLNENMTIVIEMMNVNRVCHHL